MKYEYYEKLLAYCIALIFGSMLFIWGMGWLSKVEAPLLPRSDSAVAWQPIATNDNARGGGSIVSLIDTENSLTYTYSISDRIAFPFVEVTLLFGDSNAPLQAADLSQYSRIAFSAECSAQVEMSLHHRSLEEGLTHEGDLSSSRLAEHNFICDQKPRKVEIDLNRMIVPIWWLTQYGLPVTDRHYSLNKTIQFTFDSDERSPLHQPVRVHITHVVLHGKRWWPVWAGGGILAVIWIFFLVSMLRAYTGHIRRNVKQQVATNKTLVAYQQLAVEPQNDKQKNRLLALMAAEFCNSEFTLDYATDKLGLNRNKVNDILKEELGLTFVAYLNKLRLMEATRLLSEQQTLSISEVAQAVGFNSAPYFNRLFKSHYDCSPSTFRKVYSKAAQQAVE